MKPKIRQARITEPQLLRAALRMTWAIHPFPPHRPGLAAALDRAFEILEGLRYMWPSQDARALEGLGDLGREVQAEYREAFDEAARVAEAIAEGLSGTRLAYPRVSKMGVAHSKLRDYWMVVADCSHKLAERPEEAHSVERRECLKSFVRASKAVHEVSGGLALEPEFWPFYVRR